MSTMSLSVGPQHPGSGHFRLQLKVKGDIIVDVVPDAGYVHRGEEKMCEYRNLVQNIPHLERPVILDSVGVLYPYVLACEDLLDIEVPVRAQYLRVAMAEINRIISHLYWLGIYGIFLGHSTMFMWPMGDREPFIDLAQLASGARVTFAYLVPGGVRNDVPDSFESQALKVIRYFEGRLREYDNIFFSNPLFLGRTKGVGVLTKKDAISLGAVGPTLRGSGIRSDVRKTEPYDVYDELDFDIPVLDEGDSYSRAMVAFLEMKESLKIIKQAVEKMPKGPVKVGMRGQVRLPAGESYARAEAARGAMSYYIVSDAGKFPYRIKISPPSFRNLPTIPFLLKGARLADMPVIYWGINYWPVEADR